MIGIIVSFWIFFEAKIYALLAVIIKNIYFEMYIEFFTFPITICYVTIVWSGPLKYKNFYDKDWKIPQNQSSTADQCELSNSSLMQVILLYLFLT